MTDKQWGNIFAGIAFALYLGLLAVVGIAIPNARETALQRGAKIGIALDNPDGYRADEVQGSCEDLFDADECIECHDLRGK